MKNTKKIKIEAEKAYRLYSKAASVTNAIKKMFIYNGFEEDPISSMCNGGELILVSNGSEIFIEQAIEIFEKNGVITPEDFINYR